VQVIAVDDHVVLAICVLRIEAERIVAADAAGIRGAQPAVLAGQAIAPAPLLADDLDLGRVLRHGDELVPDE
jgi:hypothetical protein